VTNVTNFGAFVDVGVHRDGLVHVSQLADRFVRDPAEVVKAGDRIRVRVLEVDLKRERISFTARRGQVPAGDRREDAPPKGGGGRPPVPREPARQFRHNPFADLAVKKR
jgi:uncharacterized protein